MGLEPFFAAGVLIAALSSTSLNLAYYASGAVQAAVFILLATSYLLEHRGFSRLSPIILTAAVTAAGAYCFLNSIIINIGSRENCGYLYEMIGKISMILQSFIDTIPFNSSDTSSLIKALVIGERTNLPRHIIEAFRSSGASHILALSGLHLGMVYGLISKTLHIFGNRRQFKITRSILNVSICTLYTLATGASASMTRALLFIILKEVGEISDRRAKLSDIFKKSLLIQLVFSPEKVLDIGFQLSYTAMAGIIWIYPHLKALWKDGSDPILTKIWHSAALSISCQFTTAPLTWCYFGTVPVHFILTNLFALPLTGIIIPFSASTILLSMLGICPEILTEATEKLIEILIDILEIISGMGEV